MSAVKKAKSKYEKFYKKKPDPAGRALGLKAHAAFIAKDFTTAKDLYERAQALCQASDTRANKEKKKTSGVVVSQRGMTSSFSDLHETLEMEVDLPRPGSEDHVIAKKKSQLPVGARNFAVNSPECLAAHVSITGGKWQTRFPPEPNGYLHIGHAKAMQFNFGLAAKHSGCTYLRFDDTNPAAEKQEYIDSIRYSVDWLGHKPFKVTYSSDYFDELYEFALKLIRQGKAYVCHQTKSETAASRQLLQEFQLYCSRKCLPRYGTPLPFGAASPYRCRSVKDNLILFDEMKRGLWEEGTCSLRMKGDLRSDVTSMWDLAAYRIKFEKHPHSSDRYCIYPTYDYTHCLVDSLENVTHSLCTLEFETRQAPNGPYYWLLDSLGLYKPITWEFARCNITHNVLSKRKLNRLITEGHVTGWDDPRLLTIEGLRRRGYTPTSINRFCFELGTTRNDNTQHFSKLERCIREELDDVVYRRFAVLDPLPVIISNHPGTPLPVNCPLHPKFPERGIRTLNLTSTVLIERSDFREFDDINFYGLAPGKSVRLLFGYNITCTGFHKDASGNACLLKAIYVPDSLNTKPPKGTLHWASADFVQGEVRVYDKLFQAEVPGKKDDFKQGEQTHYQTEGSDAVHCTDVDWLSQLNPSSLVVHENALLEPSIACMADKPLGFRFQLQRLGYFTIDRESTLKKPVLNRIVTLRESKDLRTLHQI